MAGSFGGVRHLQLPTPREPFAWTIASDNKTIVGADMNGHFHITLVSPDRIEKC